jgi:cytochrome c-type protein NapB
MTCTACHDRRGMPVEGVGFAPASPHDGTDQAYSTLRCRQCHVFQLDEGLFVENSFVGLPQDLRPGRRLTSLSPPTIPHRILMRENCSACHSGPGARTEIATSHPERTRCRQCHVAVTTPEVFSSVAGEGYAGEENP